MAARMTETDDAVEAATIREAIVRGFYDRESLENSFSGLTTDHTAHTVDFGSCLPDRRDLCSAKDVFQIRLRIGRSQDTTASRETLH